MMTVGEINVTLQLFGSVLSLMIIFCLFIGGNAKTKTGRLYVLLLILNMGGLLFDALAYMFRGKTYPFAYFGVRASNFLAFCCFCAFATAFLSYLNQFVSAKKPGACRPYMMISGCVCASYLVLYVVNLFVPIFYYIDSSNIYMRTPLYGLTMIPAFWNMLLTVIILIKQRHTYQKSNHCIRHVCGASYDCPSGADFCIWIEFLKYNDNAGRCHHVTVPANRANETFAKRRKRGR